MKKIQKKPSIQKEASMESNKKEKKKSVVTSSGRTIVTPSIYQENKSDISDFSDEEIEQYQGIGHNPKSSKKTKIDSDSELETVFPNLLKID